LRQPTIAGQSRFYEYTSKSRGSAASSNVSLYDYPLKADTPPQHFNGRKYRDR
jgi:hypothetical protein